jgi:hypothetical protein
MIMTKAKAAVKAKATVKAKPKAAAAKKTVTTAKPAVTKAKATNGVGSRAPTPQTEKAPSKASVAKVIFDQSYGKVKRADIINRLTSEANLTHNGAATYFQKMKKAIDTASA